MAVSGGFGGGGLPFSGDNPVMAVIALIVLVIVGWLLVRAFEF